jgi:hypothetical protein
MKFVHPGIDRAWLIIVALTYALSVPIWLALMVERHGAALVLAGIIGALAYRSRA